ncbi:Uncharacterised protein [Mycobacteroides abscessus subsp. abscessus]|nr:Uncharacterised protein [Mycobacteroides abscessus subsp. abscessus]
MVASEATVPTPGMAAVAPAAVPLPVTASRNCRSMRSMIWAGDSSGCARRMRSMYLSTAGPCSLAPFSSKLITVFSNAPCFMTPLRLGLG